MINLPVPQINNDFLAEFLSGRSPNTIQSYRDDLSSLAKFTNSPSSKEAIAFLILCSQGDANRLVLNFRNHLKESGLAPATINRKIATIRSCIKFARMCGVVNWSIEVQNLKSEPYRDTRGPGLQAFQKMISLLKLKKCAKSTRDMAILRLMFDLGLRVSEITQLNYEDLELDRNAIWIKGKGKSEKQLLYVPEETKLIISQWLHLRGTAYGPLFTNFDRARTRKRITRTGVYYFIIKLGLKAGIKTRPHGIRHLSITEACKAAQVNGLPLEDVLSHSRHKSVATLIIYRDQNENSQEQISKMISKLA